MYLHEHSSDDGTKIVNFFGNHISSTYTNYKFKNSSFKLSISFPTSYINFNFPLSPCFLSMSDIIRSFNSLINIKLLVLNFDFFSKIFLHHCMFIIASLPLAFYCLFNIDFSSGEYSEFQKTWWFWFFYT